MNCIFEQPTLQCSKCGFVAKSSFTNRNCPAAEGYLSRLEAAAQRWFMTGPGTQLHALLGRFGLTSSGDCKCTSRAAYMDRMEAEQPGWCEANIDEIVGWLRESAAERGLPFLDVAARLLVRRAIHNARRKDAAARGTEDRPPLRPER